MHELHVSAHSAFISRWTGFQLPQSDEDGDCFRCHYLSSVTGHAQGRRGLTVESDLRHGNYSPCGVNIDLEIDRAGWCNRGNGVFSTRVSQINFQPLPRRHHLRHLRCQLLDSLTGLPFVRRFHSYYVPEDMTSLPNLQKLPLLDDCGLRVGDDGIVTDWRDSPAREPRPLDLQGGERAVRHPFSAQDDEILRKWCATARTEALTGNRMFERLEAMVSALGLVRRLVMISDVGS